MIKGPWPLSTDKTHYLVPLERPFLTPWYHGERVALRISADDDAKVPERGRYKTKVTDLDTGLVYELAGIPCTSGESCCCDAELRDIPQA